MSCPRCAGRLYLDSDYAGRFLSCINCGNLIPLDCYDPEGGLDTRQHHYGPRGPRKGKLRGMTAAQRRSRRQPA